MKNWLIAALVVSVMALGAPELAEAKRLGGGKSSGMQRDMPARTAPDAAPAKPAAPTQQANPSTPANPGAAAPAAAGKRSWMGPIAGLAAGLGLAALMSHLGMGAEFANFIMLALLGVAAVFLVMFLLRRFGGAGSRAPTLASAGAGPAAASSGPSAWSATPAQPASANTSAFQAQPLNDPVLGSPAGAVGEAPAQAAVAPARSVERAFVPASFDGEGFARTAKMIFIRMQAANDSADLNDLRSFTTPELFASLRVDLQERGPQAQHTDVVKVEAQVLDVTHEADRQVVSVRFHGQMIEEQGTAPSSFDEVWHLVKPTDDSRSWAIAGIEQSQ